MATEEQLRRAREQRIAQRAAARAERAAATAGTAAPARSRPTRGPRRAGVAGLVRRPAPAYRRRRLAALAVLVALLVGLALAVAGLGGSDSGDGSEQPAAGPPPRPELPRGGHSILPERRVVAYYGAPQDDELGILGIGSPELAARRLERQARAYAEPRRPVLPTLELIAVVAAAHPGDDGTYALRQSDAVIRRYLRAARRAEALLMLDIQPGRSDFLAEAQRLRKWLREPDVSLAIDPEWRVTAPEVPAQVIGHVDADEVNATSAWLSRLVEGERLPDKLFLIHQFTDDMVDETALRPRKGLDVVLNADGFGSRVVKKQKYHRFTRQAPGFHQGFKLFYKEDVDLMPPPRVLRMKPPPDVVIYE